MGQNSADQIEFIDSHSSNPIVENLFGIQYRSVKLSGIGHLKADDERLIIVCFLNTYLFLSCSKNMGVVVGKNYESQRDAYNTYPCQSSVIGDYVV